MHGVSLKITFAKWLPLGLTIIGTIAFAYVGLQQLNRMQMNDPQIQMAEDAAASLGQGADPATVVPAASIDIANSLSPWIGVYDTNGQPVAVNARLDGQSPTPPAGIFSAALARGEDRVTWQPEAGVRIALVVRPVPNSTGWFAVSGRSMREGEGRMNEIGLLAVLAAIILIVITLGLEYFGAWRHMRAMAAQQQPHA